MPVKKSSSRSRPAAKARRKMTYEEAQGPAAFSVLEALCWVLLDKGVIPAAALQKEVERYAKMHEGAPDADGSRSPEDGEVARAMRFLARMPSGARS